jgi:hypothetical protein
MDCSEDVPMLLGVSPWPDQGSESKSEGGDDKEAKEGEGAGADDTPPVDSESLRRARLQLLTCAHLIGYVVCLIDLHPAAKQCPTPASS